MHLIAFLIVLRMPKAEITATAIQGTASSTIAFSGLVRAGMPEVVLGFEFSTALGCYHLRSYWLLFDDTPQVRKSVASLDKKLVISPFGAVAREKEPPPTAAPSPASPAAESASGTPVPVSSRLRAVREPDTG
jgi:hypothetical protein